MTDTISDRKILNQVCKYVLMMHKHEVKETIRNLLSQLEGYTFLRCLNQKMPTGCYVRYIKKDYLDTRIKQGGYLEKYNDKYIYLKKHGKQWKVERINHFIFYTTDTSRIPKQKRKEKQYKITLIGKE